MQKILFWGVCGASMSALACLSAKNYEVWGYDDFQTPNLKNINIATTIDAKFLKTFDIIVYTVAIANKNQLISFCKSNNIIIYERAEYLALFSKQFSKVIAISGTHGKTTTTAMIGEIFRVANLNPTVHLGGIVNDWQSNYLVGNEIFITEACEYNKSFLKLKPDVALITNIEAEHLDTYHSLENEQQAFMQFAKQSKLVICESSININNAITYGLDNSCFISATDIMQKNGKYSFVCVINGKNVGKISLKVLGKHNLLNALGGIAVATQFNIEFELIKKALENFNGVYRRLTKVAQNNLGTHFLDYAHHPTEIQATLDTLNQLPHKNLVAIFQPHTYSRTLTLMNEFCSCFKCDELYLLPTYPARENYIAGGDALDLFYNLNGKVSCKYFNNAESLYYDLEKTLCKNTIVAWIGAGNIDRICLEFTKKTNPN